MNHNGFIFLLLITFLFPNVIKGKEQWEQINRLDFSKPTAIKKFHISHTTLGILFENNMLKIWTIKKNSIEPTPSLIQHIDDFIFSPHKDNILYVKMLDQMKFEKRPLANNFKDVQQSNEFIFINSESELSLSTESQNSLTASIEIVSPSTTQKTFDKNGLFAVQGNHPEKKISSEEKINPCLIKIFNLHDKILFDNYDPIYLIIAESGVKSFKFLLNKKFFMVLQKSGILNIYETDTWKSIFEQRNVSLYNLSADEQLLGILKENDLHLVIFKYM